MLSIVFLPLAAGVLKMMMEKKLNLLKFKEEFNDVFFSMEHYSTFFDWNPINAAGWFLILIVSLAAIRKLIAGRVEMKERYEDRSDYGSHGTARWQTSKEIKKQYYTGEPGFIVGDLDERVYKPEGKYAVVPNNGTTNMNIIAFGPPGSEKTTGLILPNLFHVIRNLGYSFVATDPKGEIYQMTAAEAKKKGYEVQVLDFLRLERGNRINFCDFIQNETDLLKIADSFLAGESISKGSKGGNDSFWDESAKTLLAAIIGFVMQVYKDQPAMQNFSKVAEILLSEFRNPETLPELFERNGVTGTAKALFDSFILSSGEVRDNIMVSLAMKLTFFSVPGVQNLTSTSDFDIKELGRRKIALYVMVSDADRTYSPLVTVFWSIFFDTIYNLRLTDPDAKTPIFCAMDELANIGRIGGLQEKLGTMRSRHIYPMMIWQSLPQLKDRYPDNAWKDILSMCDTRLLLAANDEDTQKYFSELLGKKTVEIQGVSKNIKREDILHNGEGESINYTGRPLLFPDEIGKLPSDQIIMIQKGKDPVRLRKLQYQYWNKEYQICEETPYNNIEKLPNVAHISTESREDHESQDDVLSIDFHD